MSTTPSASAASPVAATDSSAPAPTDHAADKPTNAAVAETSADAASESQGQEQEELDEQTHLFGRFVLFNAVPSSLISGVVHFVLFLVLALTSMSPAPEKKTLELSATAVQKTDKADELANESIDVPLDQSAADERTDAAQQVLQNV